MKERKKRKKEGHKETNKKDKSKKERKKERKKRKNEKKKERKFLGFAWTYRSFGMAAGQVLMCIQRSVVTPDFYFFIYFTEHLIGVPSCLVNTSNARLRLSCTYGRSLSCVFCGLRGRTGSSGWLLARF